MAYSFADSTANTWVSNWLRKPTIRVVLGYALAIVSVSAAFAAAQAFLYLHLPLAIMSFSFCAIAITFWYGGVIPGILAVVLVVLIRTFVFSTGIDLISRISYDLVFVLFSVFMAQATRARNELEVRVAKRTAALTKANEDLQLENVERKRAEEALQEHVAALRSALEEIQLLKDQLYKENLALREEIDVDRMFQEIVGSSPALQGVLSGVAKVAPTDSTVLITGETGTGKELIARAIHKRSQRSSHAFVSVNCAAIPRDLIASELFGHEKGAFTGATQRRLGRFESADGGTIFLDEVGELPLETQIALLRVLQEHEFERVGGTVTIQTNVRLVAATNRNLQEAIAAGTFRSDLFYRINVFPIDMPPLRERREDIPALVEYFVDRCARKVGKNIQEITKESLDLLRSYPWPGNIRELQNVIERSVIMCETEDFSVDKNWLAQQPLATVPKIPLGLSEKLAAQEKEMIEAALRESAGRVLGPSGAATKLGIPRSTLESKIRSLKISKNSF